MERYTVTFVNSAAREFRNLPHEIKTRIALKIDALQNVPRPAGVIKLSGEKNYIEYVLVITGLFIKSLTMEKKLR